MLKHKTNALNQDEVQMKVMKKANIESARQNLKTIDESDEADMAQAQIAQVLPVDPNEIDITM